MIDSLKEKLFYREEESKNWVNFLLFLSIVFAILSIYGFYFSY